MTGTERANQTQGNGMVTDAEHSKTETKKGPEDKHLRHQFGVQVFAGSLQFFEQATSGCQLNLQATIGLPEVFGKLGSTV